MTPSSVSVVIPAFNEASRIATAIESALAAGAGEVVVCDGGSDDETRKRAESAGASVIESDRGRGKQLRTGAENTRGEVLLFLHADNALAPDCLNQICAHHQLAGKAEDLWGGFRQRINARGLLYRSLEQGNAARIRFRGLPFGDQAMFCTRSLYERVGGIDDLPLMEDVNFSQSLRNIAWPKLLDGPVLVDARRWQQRGVIRQTLRNWSIQTAHAFGVAEERLNRWYR